MAKSIFGKALTAARMVKSTIGLVDFFTKQANRFLTPTAEEDSKLQDSYAGKNLLLFPRLAQDKRWIRFENADPIRKAKVLTAWIIVAEAKIEPIKARIPKSQTSELWKDHLENWQNFIVRCRSELNNLES